MGDDCPNFLYQVFIILFVKFKEVPMQWHFKLPVLLIPLAFQAVESNRAFLTALACYVKCCIVGVYRGVGLHKIILKKFRILPFKGAENF